MPDQIKILYVDDESMNLFIFREQFRRRHEVITAISGEEGLGLLDSEEGIKVVISDMRMPNMDGLEFIRLAREKRKGIIYCILTGFDLNNELKEALDSKLIDHYFTKPYVAKEIDSAIFAALQSRD